MSLVKLTIERRADLAMKHLFKTYVGAGHMSLFCLKTITRSLKLKIKRLKRLFDVSI